MAKSTRYKGIRKLADGSFHIRVSYTDPRTGKRREKKDTVQGTIKDALAAREKLRQSTGDTRGQTIRKRVSEYARPWMQRKVRELAPSTIDRYRVALDQHIVTDLGDFYYDALNRDDVQAWVNGNLDKGYAVGSVRGWFRIFTTMTRDAIAELQLTCDPTLRIRFPEASEGAKSEAVTPVELDRFLAAMRADFPQHHALIIVLAYSGLRFCHASALRWEDWDEARNVLHIQRSQVRGKVSQVRLKKQAPKLLPVLPIVADTLRWHRQRMVDAQAPGLAEGWMFPSRVGTLRSTSSVAKAFARCRDQAGITARFTVHGMRYTFTDSLRVAGIDPIVRRELIGHHTERMQANYSTVRIDEHRQALDQVAQLITAESQDVYSAVYSEPDSEGSK